LPSGRLAAGRLAVVRFIAVGLALTISLAGCTAPSAPYGPATAAALQAQVLTVSQAATTDPAAALTRLDELAASADDAFARGTVTSARHTSILAAIALVRADLESAVAAAAAASAARAQEVAEAAAAAAAARNAAATPTPAAPSLPPNQGDHGNDKPGKTTGPGGKG
jgi:hypothetical protein